MTSVVRAGGCENIRDSKIQKEATNEEETNDQQMDQDTKLTINQPFLDININKH